MRNTGSGGGRSPLAPKQFAVTHYPRTSGVRTPIIPTRRISITLGAVETSVVVSIRARRTFREVRTSRSWRRDTAQDVRIGQTG